MRFRRARRIAGVLIASQLRSGRSTSNPRALLGRPVGLLLLDAGVFFLPFLVGYYFLGLLAAVHESLSASLVAEVFPYIPLVAVGAVLVAGVMFELTTTARFAGSDVVNWLPVSPVEYVAGSTMAVSFVYSLVLAFLLGATLPVALFAGVLPLYIWTVAVSIVALIQGGVLIEILRGVTQKATGMLPRRGGSISLFVRAAALIVVLLLFQLFFNPVLLLGLLHGFGGFNTLATFVPFFWASRAVIAFVNGSYLGAGVFAAGQVAVVTLLLFTAARLRERFWSVTAPELTLSEHRYASRHPILAFFGLSPIEASITSKDLRGFTRRRELLPLLITPLVIAIVTIVEGNLRGPTGPFTQFLSLAWVSGFFALLLATTSIGQEKKAFQNLYALPVPPRSLFRSKVATSSIIAATFGLVAGAAVTAYFRIPAWLVLPFAALVVGVVLEATFIGLAVAVRYADFQERPRPQYVRPGAMLGGMFLGVVVVFGTVIPALTTLLQPPGLSIFGLLPGIFAVGLAITVVTVGFFVARSGTDQLMRELPT